ncbi:MAG: putative Ig domain-containing protein [Caulobacteraceae bacterium]
MAGIAQTLAQIAAASGPAPSTIANPASVDLYIEITANGVVTPYAITLAQLAAYIAAINGGSTSTLAIAGAPAAATVGTPYNFSPDATGGVTPYASYALSGALPAGLTFSTLTGEISGTPTAVGTTSGLSITVTDATGATATLGPFSITVAAAAGAGGIGLTNDLSSDGLADH